MDEIKNNVSIPNFINTMSPSVLLPTGHMIDFEIGQIVYLKTDKEQHQRMVTAICLRPNRNVMYCLTFGNTESWHYKIEIDNERDIMKATTG